MVTVYDVAREAGVSIASVSRALNGQPGVRREIAERVRQVAAELGYSPNEIARSLVAKTSGSIALMLPDITNPFFPALVKGVQTAADERGYTLLLSDSADRPQKLVDDLEVLRRKQIDGAIIISVDATGLEGLASACDGLPVVALDRALDLPRASTVGVDHEAGAYDAVAHLIELGHERVAHVGGPADLDVSRQRLAGWQRALEDHGCPVAPDLVVTGDFTEAGGFEAGSRLLERRSGFTAVFVANDLSAVGLLAACAEGGVDVPGEISVVGFDGIHLVHYTSPRLTTVAQPIFELGRRAGELLLEQVADPSLSPRHEILPTRLVLGTSTAAPRSA